MQPADLVTLGQTAVPVSRLSLGGTPLGDMYDVVTDQQAAT
jgi:hypothetical protein